MHIIHSHLGPASPLAVHVVSPVLLHIVHGARASTRLVDGGEHPTLKLQQVPLRPARVPARITRLVTLWLLITKELRYQTMSTSATKGDITLLLTCENFLHLFMLLYVQCFP